MAKNHKLKLAGDLSATVSVLSDVGSVRANNEDSMGVFPGSDPERGHLLVVADGMGGAAAGEVASRVAVEVVSREYFSPEAPRDPRAALDRAIRAANQEVYRQSVEDPSRKGMGTTCTAVVLLREELVFGHVGDSRAYLASEGSLHALTEDHTLAAEMERHHGPHGVPREAHNILTRCLGVREEVDVDIAPDPIPVGEGDVLLICSDGLTGMVPDEVLLREMTTREPEDACRKLVELACAEGGIDNITLQIARFDSD